MYVFSLRDNSEKTVFILTFLCGWLNSDLMTFYAQQTSIIRFSQGKQPQIKISDLGTIPYPSSLLLQQKIVDLVNEIMNHKENIDRFKSELNQLIFDYYALNSDEIQHLLNSIKVF